MWNCGVYYSFGKHYIIIYYVKYHCELNHIEQICYGAKKWACENWNYILDNLK